MTIDPFRSKSNTGMARRGPHRSRTHHADLNEFFKWCDTSQTHKQRRSKHESHTFDSPRHSLYVWFVWSTVIIHVFKQRSNMSGQQHQGLRLGTIQGSQFVAMGKPLRISFAKRSTWSLVARTLNHSRKNSLSAMSDRCANRGGKQGTVANRISGVEVALWRQGLSCEAKTSNEWYSPWLLYSCGEWLVSITQIIPGVFLESSTLWCWMQESRRKYLSV